MEEHRRGGEEYHRRQERKNWDMQNGIAIANNIITGIGVFFSIVAAGGAIAAAIFAYGAYAQSKRQADAAWVSANASSEPYLSLTFTNSAQIQAEIGAGAAPVGIALANYGEAPAIIDDVECASVWGNQTSVDFSMIDGHGYDRVDDLKPGEVISKGGSVSVPCEINFPLNPIVSGLPRRANDDQVRDAMFNHPLWVLARVNFEDVFGAHHRSVFCARYSYNGAYFGDTTAFDKFKAPECKDHSDD